MKPTCEEILAVMNEIGKSIMAKEIDNSDLGACHRKYKLSNGWEIVVFDECDGSWDYLDSVKPKDGEWVDLYDDAHGDFYEPIMNHYSPSEETLDELRLS